MLTIGSLFSGIGGLELGIEAGLAAAGYPSRTIWQVEQDDYCRAVLARHWPHAHRYTDVTTLDPSSMPAVDIVCGGFPCQDISSAGKGAGIHGARSGLFYDMAALVRHLRPRVWIMENVSAINVRGLDEVLGTVAALGYDARWGSLRASDVGAPHRRERWFCVAWVADHDRERGDPPTRMATGERADLSDLDRGGGRRAINPDALADRIGIGLEGQHQAGTAARTAHRENRAPQPRPAESRMGRDPDGISGWLDRHRWPAPPGPHQHSYEPPRTHPRQPTDKQRLKALGNAVVPQQAAVIGRWVGEHLLARC